MPRVSDGSEQQAYGVAPGEERLSFRERLMRRFASHEFVRVINVDNESYRWQYLPTRNEEFEFTPDPMKITRRAPVEVYELAPGESEVIIGENAYVMIEGLYKRLVAKKVINKNPNATQARNFNWNDGTMQEEMIDKILLGKESPSFKSEVNSNAVTAPSTTAGTGRLRRAS